jgi:CTP:molybdopterin cytidylyltransferase MocA
MTDNNLEDELANYKNMLVRISIHGASGLWTGEDCAIGATAALDGEEAARKLMQELGAKSRPVAESLKTLEDWDGMPNR